MVRNVLRTSILLLAFGFIAMDAEAKNLYVDSNTGDDAVTYAENSSTRPWRSLGRALWGGPSWQFQVPAQAAQPGDVVLVSGGTQSTPASGERYAPAFNAVNNGTAANPITIRAVGRVELRNTPGSGQGPVIGAYERDYIHWQGFVLNENNSEVHADTGLAVVFLSQGIVIDGCEIIGINQTYGDNHNGVRLEQADDIAVRNCLITGITGNVPGGDIYHHNNAGVMLYGGRNVVIENNEISNCGAGVFPKGSDNYGITIRYNLIRNCSKGIRNTYSHATLGVNRAYQNVIVNQVRADGMGVQLAEFTHNWTVVNNTIVNFDNGVYMYWNNPGNAVNTMRFGSNLTYNTTTPINAWEWGSATLPTVGRNFYHGATQWALQGRTFNSLAAWLVVAPLDGGWVTGNPMFVDAANGNYRLAAGSPAATVGRDVLGLSGVVGATIPAGAYITGNEVIGRNIGPTPNPPTNVTVGP
jgi:parallel beta-helix repeat protein